MKAVILAAGRGTRFGEITKKTPKSLLLVNGKPILEYTLSSLPSSIEEVFIVIGHLGRQIKNKFGSNFKNLKINYVEMRELTGTWFALKAVEPFLKKETFLVLNGDDIYDRLELEKMINNNPVKSPKGDHGVNWVFGLAKAIPQRSTYLTFEVDKKGNLNNARYPTKKEIKEGILLATGAYVLDTDIFKYQPVKLSTGEYGLPQTILKATKKRLIKTVLMKKWLQINTPKDIKKADKIFKHLNI